MDYIEINGYKSIKSERIDLRKINVLIGANGSGKSNLLSFFDFLNQLYERNLNNYIVLSAGGKDKILHRGSKITDRISFKVEFDSGINGYEVAVESGADGFAVTMERLIFKGRTNVDISRSDRDSRLKITDNYRAKYVIKYLEGLRKYHFHDTGVNSPFDKSNNVFNDAYYLYRDGSNLSTFLFHIRNTNKIAYNLILNIIRSIAPYFSDFYLKPNEANLMRLQWKDKYSDVVYGATDLSDGTIRFIALTVLFMQPELPDTIVIDEPELGLHPDAIAKVANMIKSVADRGKQVIVATQSTDLIGYFCPEDIVAVDQIKGESKFERLRSEDYDIWLQDYTLDNLWKRNIISKGQPNFA